MLHLSLSLLFACVLFSYLCFITVWGGHSWSGDNAIVCHMRRRIHVPYLHSWSGDNTISGRATQTRSSAAQQVHNGPLRLGKVLLTIQKWLKVSLTQLEHSLYARDDDDAAHRQYRWCNANGFTNKNQYTTSYVYSEIFKSHSLFINSWETVWFTKSNFKSNQQGAVSLQPPRTRSLGPNVQRHMACFPVSTTPCRVTPRSFGTTLSG